MPNPRRSPSRFIGYPADSLLAVVPGPEQAAAAAAALKAGGLTDADVTVLRGEEGATRLDATGASHGIGARVRRLASFTIMDQLPDMAWYEAAVREGQAVVMAHVVGGEAKAGALAVLRAHEGHFINYYGRLQTEDIDPWRGPEPAVHHLLKR
jgi:hypothetical protein